MRSKYGSWGLSTEGSSLIVPLKPRVSLRKPKVSSVCVQWVVQGYFKQGCQGKEDVSADAKAVRGVMNRHLARSKHMHHDLLLQ